MQDLPIVIVGAGPANLIAAAELATAGLPVHIYEQNKAAGRKFLVAGHGGFNLSHSEDIETFVQRYDKAEIKAIVRAFDNNDMVRWLNNIGVSTYVGSSGKVFPQKDMKPIEVLQAILQCLTVHNVKIFYEHRMLDFNGEYVEFVHKDRFVSMKYQKLLLGLGGGSWSKTGSDGNWVQLFKSKGIKINSLQPANSGLNTIGNYLGLEGKVLKNVRVSLGEQSKSGEVLFTNYGIEGSPIYYMNRYLRKEGFPTTVHLDLKPTYSLKELVIDLSETRQKISDILRFKIKLSAVALSLTKRLTKEVYLSPDLLAEKLKCYPVEVRGFREIDEVISTAGGVCFSELDSGLSLREYPAVYCVGEMLDWEAPTGGYLLQACFSSGFWAAQAIKTAILKV